MALPNEATDKDVRAYQEAVAEHKALLAEQRTTRGEKNE